MLYLPASHLRFVQPFKEFLYLLFSFLSGYSIPFLQLAVELIHLAIDLSDVIVSQVTPLFLDLSRHLLPLSFYLIPIHDCLLSLLFSYYYLNLGVARPLNSRIAATVLPIET